MDDKSKSATDNQLNPDGAPAKDENFDIQWSANIWINIHQT